MSNKTKHEIKIELEDELINLDDNRILGFNIKTNKDNQQFNVEGFIDYNQKS